MHEFPPRVSSYGAMSTCLEDKFEVIKDIGDGSFGSVVLARVRTAGSHVARRGSVVSKLPFFGSLETYSVLGRHQNNEEDLRFLPTMSGASRSHLPPHSTCTRSSRAGARHLPRSSIPQASHLYGIHGWQPLSTDESTGT